MAKKRKAKIPKRSDAERRVRQGERLSRLLRALHCIMGSPGRWDADALARELEVSPRTIHRIMQTLSMAGVPWFYVPNEGYRVRDGFRFPGIDGPEQPSAVGNPAALKVAVEKLLKELSRTVESLKRFNDELERSITGS